MASREYIDGKTIFLFLKRINATVPETTFRTVACIDNVDFAINTEKKEVKNRCTGRGSSGIAGDITWTASASGQAISDVDTAEANYQELADISIDGETVEIKLANADGSYYRAGEAMITSYSETAPETEFLGFSVNFDGFEIPVIVKPA